MDSHCKNNQRTPYNQENSRLFFPVSPFRSPIPYHPASPNLPPPSISVTQENKTGRENASPPGCPFCRALPTASHAYSKRQSLTLSPSISLLSLCTPPAPLRSLSRNPRLHPASALTLSLLLLLLSYLSASLSLSCKRASAAIILLITSSLTGLFISSSRSRFRLSRLCRASSAHALRTSMLLRCRSASSSALIRLTWCATHAPRAVLYPNFAAWLSQYSLRLRLPYLHSLNCIHLPPAHRQPQPAPPHPPPHIWQPSHRCQLYYHKPKILISNFLNHFAPHP